MAFDPLTELNTLPDLFRMTGKVYWKQIKTILACSGILFAFLVLPVEIIESSPEWLFFFWIILFLLGFLLVKIAVIKTTENTLGYQTSVAFIEVLGHVIRHIFEPLMIGVGASFRILVLIIFAQIIFGAVQFYIHLQIPDFVITILTVVIIAGGFVSYQFNNQLAVLRFARDLHYEKRTRKLLTGQWWRTNLISLLGLILLIGLIFLVGLIPFGDYFGYVLAFWISFVPPFHTIFRTLLFLNLEARQGMAPWQQTPSEVIEPSAQA